MKTPLRIWITGASSGIGRACALALAEAGHRVWASARSLDQLESLSRESANLKGNLIAHPVDVTSPEQVRACAKAMVETWGGIDVVIPNAGMGLFNPLQEAPLSEWHTMVQVNISRVLSTIHAALPSLRSNKGHVINIGSLAARQVFPNSGVYCATKHAVLAISESLRTEFRNDLAVTTINPGAVNTPFIDRTNNEEFRANYRPQFDAGMTAEYVAEGVLFAVESRGKGVVSELTLRPDRREL